MDSSLIPVSSFENAWSRLSNNPNYQRCVTSFFKAHSFYVHCSGLYAGTSKATGRRAVYCDEECCERLSAELAALVAKWLGEQAQHPPLATECVEEIQALNLQSEDDVKALFKDFKRAARVQKQCRQLAAARELLLDARRWTAPFRVPPPAPPATLPTAAREGCSAANGGVCRACEAGKPRSHPISAESGWSSQSENDEEGALDCNGGCGPPSRHLVLAAADPEAPEPATACTAAASAATPAGKIAPAAAGAFARACGEHSTLRKLRTAACGDPWVSVVAAATPHLAGSSACLASGCSSVAPSSVATPVWPPTTPHYGLSAPFASAATAVIGTVSPPCEPNGRACFHAGAAMAAAASTTASAAAAAAAAERCALGSSRIGGVGGGAGGGAEGVLVVCCSVDLEWWERDNSRVTEIGWTLWDNLTRSLESRHHIVSEHEALVNRIHVPDHKHDFLFGASSNGSLAEGAAALQADMDSYGQRVWSHWWAQERQGQQQLEGQEGQEGPPEQAWPEGEQQGPRQGAPAANGLGSVKAPSDSGEAAAALPSGAGAVAAEGASSAADGVPPAPPMQLVIVGHGLSQDLRALSNLLGVTIPPGAAILDTADLAWAVLEAAPGQEKTAMSLRVLLKTLGIPATKLHNGGNDARYTMEAVLALTQLEPKGSGAGAVDGMGSGAGTAAGAGTGDGAGPTVGPADG